MGHGEASHSQSGSNYINASHGFWSWAGTLDHKRIGLMYLYSILIFFFMGGVFALLVRAELFTPGQTLMTADQYNRAFTYHGTIMVFLVIIPMIPAAFGNMVLPMMLGAKDVAFPRLNLASYYIFMGGAAVALTTLFVNGVDTGWTFYAPYSTRTSSSAAIMLAAAFILGFSSILTGLNFIATVHKLRCKGLTWGRLPLFIWSLYATSIIQVLATPVLACTLGMIALERFSHYLFGPTGAIGIFDPTLGGDPVLFQHFFWFYSHPAVYIMVLPAMGVISEVICVYSRKAIFGYKAMAAAIFGIALVSFVVWGHHMYTSGQSVLANFIFSIITMFVAVPTGVKVFSWIATLYKGSIHFNAAMLWAFAFLFVFTIGGLTGVVLATLGADVNFHDTYYVVAHFHYVMVGGTMMAFMAAIHHWMPKFIGRMYNEFWAKISWFLVFVGFNLTFFTQFILGHRGMPRRYYDYLPEYTYLNQVSTVGSMILGVGFLIALCYLTYGVFKGPKASANPWGSATLEWDSPSPPPTENFLHDPEMKHGPYDYAEIKV